MSADIRALLDLTAEASRRDLLQLGGKALADELNRRRRLADAAVAEAMKQCKAHYARLDKEFNERNDK